jgi:hypothetical protein
VAISNLTQGARPGICTSTSRPTNPYEGFMIFETDTNRVLVWDNAAWVMIADTDEPPGLQLVKTQTVGTTVTSVNVTSAFSSTYDAYRIVYSGGVGSANITLSLQLGASTTGYYSIVNFATYATVTTSASDGENNANKWTRVGYAGSGFTQASFDLINPSLARWTTLNNASWAATTVAGTSNGIHQVSTAYTDFTIGVNTGTITGGTIRVYGYRN